MLKIAVCIKQVPTYSDGMMDNESGVMIRKGVESRINVYDLPAIETALKIKEEIGSRVDVFTMGPSKAEEVIKEAYSMGVDNGYLISDKAFAGADVLATSYTLMQAIKSVDSYELILCGKQTTDGDTAQVSGALAKWLDIPHMNWVTKIIDIQPKFITTEQVMEEQRIISKVIYPCVLSVEPMIAIPRMPTLKLKLAVKKKVVNILSLENMEDQDSNHYGLTGSATQVEKIFTPKQTIKQPIIKQNPRQVSLYLLDKIQEIIKPS